MARYPPDVGRAPVHILRLVIEDILEGGGSIKHVPAHGVQHALQGEGTALSARAPRPSSSRGEHHSQHSPSAAPPPPEVLLSLSRTGEPYLGFPRGAAGVEDEEFVLRVTPLGLALRAGTVHQLVPPHVRAWVPGGLRKAQD